MPLPLPLRPLPLAVFALAAAGCSRDGADPLPSFDDGGGTLAVPGCGYAVTSRLGAEAPRLADAFVGPDPTVRLVHLGLVGDPRTSVVASWRTVDETTRATTIRFAPGVGLTADQLTQARDGLQFAYKAGARLYRVHQAHLCGLAPGTSYSYQVGSPGAWSPVYTFHTAPDVAAHPDAEVVLGFVGDSRGGYDTWQALIEQFRRRAPDLLLFSGDAVTIGLVQDEWEEFFARAEPLFATTPVIAAHGNHEGNAVNFFSQLPMPGDQETFGLDAGFAHLTVFNDTPASPAALASAVAPAVEADLAASEHARWKLVMHHQPAWSASSRHGSNLDLQQRFGPMFDAHRVDLVLNGHEHDFELTRPLRGGVAQASNADGTVYLVAGGAGAELYPNGSGAWTSYSESSHTAALVRVRRDRLSVEAFHEDGSPVSDPAAAFTKLAP